MNYNELLEYGLIIYNRDGIDIKPYLNKLNKTEKYFILNDAPKYDISSTKIREAINKYYSLYDMIDIEILNIILENNLYKN